MSKKKILAKDDIVSEMMSRGDMSRSAAEFAYEVFLDSIKALVLREGGRLQLREFGSFEVVKRAPRMGRNPKTGEQVPVPARLNIRFRASEKLVDQLNGE